jgi:hypothetical protein
MLLFIVRRVKFYSGFSQSEHVIMSMKLSHPRVIFQYLWINSNEFQYLDIL